MRTACLLLLCSGLFVLTACDASETQQTIDLIARGVWTPTDLTAVPGLAERYDFRDNGRLVLTFADGSTLRTEWALDENATILVVREQDGSQRDLPIVTLTEDEMVLDFEDTEVTFIQA